MTVGKALERSNYSFGPTILAGLSHGRQIVDKEQCGPALRVVSYRDLDDAIERANATHFGLSGYVWSSDFECATAVAAKLECGTAGVNNHLALPAYQPSADSNGAASAWRVDLGASPSSRRARCCTDRRSRTGSTPRPNDCRRRSEHRGEVVEIADQVLFPLNGWEVAPEYGHPERADPGELEGSESLLQSNPGCES